MILFGLVVILYTSIGGFKAVAITDAIQAMVMVAATVTILVAIVHKGGGSAALVEKIAAANPSMVDPEATAKPTILSYWILVVGLGLLVCPRLRSVA